MSTNDKLNTINTSLNNIKTAIIAKGATPSGNITTYATAISNIPQSSAVISSLSVTPTTSAQTITAPSGTDGYSPISVSAVTSSIDANITAGNIKKDVTILGVTGTYEGSGGGSGTTDVPLTRFKDDTNTEIGTHYMNFVDGNGNTYKIIVLDAKYRLESSQWCSERDYVTNMPTYYDNLSAWWYDNTKETATQNTQLILDYCSANGYTSTSCSHCRSKSFTINGTTYYGQLPNMREVFDMWRHRVQIEQMDTSANTSTSTNFSSKHHIWSSTQANNMSGWYIANSGQVNITLKGSGYFACPVLEIPA